MPVTASHRVSKCLAGLLVLLVASGLGAQGKGKKPGDKPPADKPKAEKQESIAVLMIGDEIKTVKESGLKQEQKGVEADYKKALNNWEIAKKEAAKKKSKFTDPKPVKKKVKVVKLCKTQEEADKVVAEQRKKLEKSGEKGGDKKPDPADKKDGDKKDGDRGK